MSAPARKPARKMRQNSSARSTRPSMNASAPVGIASSIWKLAQLGRFDAPAELFEFNHAVFGVPAFLRSGGRFPARRSDRRWAPLPDDRARNCCRVDIGVDGMQKNVANRAVERIDRFDERNKIGAREFAKKSRRDQHDLVTRLELAFVFEPPLFRPRR